MELPPIYFQGGVYHLLVCQVDENQYIFNPSYCRISDILYNTLPFAGGIAA